ncbi:MAG: FecR family protein, partial [Pedobacter sp.]
MADIEQFETSEEIYSHIIDDLEGTILSENKVILDKWRAENVTNEQIYQDFLSVQLNMDKLYSREGYDVQSSWESLDQKIKQPARFLWYKIAAAVLLTISIGYYFILADKYIILTTEASTAVSKVVLPDGTIVNLNTGTTIKYSKNDFMVNRKLILLQGEVFVKVVNHEGRQFRVDLGEVQAADIGTSFNVSRNDQKISVIVEEGEVALGHADHSEQVLLTAGKLGIYDTDTKSLSSAGNPDINYKAWMDKHFIFQEVPFQQVAGQLEKVYKIPLEIRGAALKNRKLTARLHYQT